MTLRCVRVNREACAVASRRACSCVSNLHPQAMRIRALLVIALSATAARAQQPATDNTQRYTRTNAMIVMRDGVRLNTDIYVPKDQQGPLPMIFERTPYGIDGRVRVLNSSFRELADDGYIFVFQDIRGRFKSDGQFVMQRPARSSAQRRDPKAIDEATDAYDTIDWL